MGWKYNAISHKLKPAVNDTLSYIKASTDYEMRMPHSNLQDRIKAIKDEKMKLYNSALKG